MRINIKLGLAIILFILSSVSRADDSSAYFLFFGDSGTGTSEQYRVAKTMESFCQADRCDFSLLLGDNFYPAGVSDVEDSQWKKKFLDPYQPLRLDFFAILGNHDYLGNTNAQIEFTSKSTFWQMPARFYQFAKGPIDFFMIDTNDFNKKQQDWLRSVIKMSRAQWKVVAGHHPIYSYGEHGHTKKLIKSLLPIISKDVDFYLSGHDHDLQVLQDGQLTFVVSGAAGQLRATESGEKTLFAKGTLGFSHFSIDQNEALLRLIDQKGETIYQASYSKRRPVQQSVKVMQKKSAQKR